MPKVVRGGIYSNERGNIRFYNKFDLSPIVRMYIIDVKLDVVRAWQGHKIEPKWFVVLEGELKIKAVPINVNSNISLVDCFQITVLKSDNKIVHIPAGYYNGFKAFKPNSKLLILSNLTISESLTDDYRLSTKELNWI